MISDRVTYFGLRIKSCQHFNIPYKASSFGDEMQDVPFWLLLNIRYTTHFNLGKMRGMLRNAVGSFVESESACGNI